MYFAKNMKSLLDEIKDAIEGSTYGFIIQNGPFCALPSV